MSETTVVVFGFIHRSGIAPLLQSWKQSFNL